MAGATLDVLAKEEGVSRERIRQLIPTAHEDRRYWRNWEIFVCEGLGDSIKRFCYFVTRHGRVSTYTHYGCRCGRCSTTMAKITAAWKKDNPDKYLARQERNREAYRNDYKIRAYHKEYAKKRYYAIKEGTWKQ